MWLPEQLLKWKKESLKLKSEKEVNHYKSNLYNCCIVLQALDNICKKKSYSQTPQTDENAQCFLVHICSGYLRRNTN